MQDWKMIFSSSQLATASIVTSLLNENGIPAKALNKQDSSFVFMGKVEVYVPNDFEQKAIELIATLNIASETT